MARYSATLLLLSLLPTVISQNDWSVPCFSGTCQYDSSSAGTLKIWGSESAISDITKAAGWEILGCSPDELSQDIRLVCTGEAGCDNLYANNGAVGKIVRLPENCGKSAFARVAKAWVPEDQSIPSSLAARFARRSQPEVKALHLDTQFSAVDASVTGPVHFSISGSDLKSQPATGASKRDANDISFDNSTTLPVSFDQSRNIFNTSIGCGSAISAAASVDVNAKADATITLGLAANGTLIPPSVDFFQVKALMTADITGTLNLAGSVQGSIDSGKIEIISIPLGAVEVPGVLTIGPTFDVNAQAKANLDLDVNLLVGLNYGIKQATFIFPPDNQQANGGFDILDTPLKLSLSPDVTSSGSVEAHIIPQLTLGIKALDDKVDTSVFIALDTSAKMQLQLEGKTDGAVNVPISFPSPAVHVSSPTEGSDGSNAEAASAPTSAPAVHVVSGPTKRMIKRTRQPIIRRALADGEACGADVDCESNNCQLVNSLFACVPAGSSGDGSSIQTSEPQAVSSSSSSPATSTTESKVGETSAPSQSTYGGGSGSYGYGSSTSSSKNGYGSGGKSSYGYGSGKNEGSKKGSEPSYGGHQGSGKQNHGSKGYGNQKGSKGHHVSVKGISKEIYQLVDCLSQCKYNHVMPPSMRPDGNMGDDSYGYGYGWGSPVSDSDKMPPYEESGSGGSSESGPLGSGGSGSGEPSSGSGSGDSSGSGSSSGSESGSGSTPPPSDSGSQNAGSDPNALFGGCFEIDVGLDITTGASAKFFDLFDQSTQATLFNKNFQLFKKCFGNDQNVVFGSGNGNAAACPADTVAPATSVEDTTIAVADIKPL